MVDVICAVEDCGRPRHRRSEWCNMHYTRARRKGDPGGAEMLLVHAPLADRYAVKIGPATIAGCRPWRGFRNPQGYGMIGTTAGQARLAHRVGWELLHGPIPDGMLVCHACDNPPCQSPEHWFLGTHADNMADMARKGRVVSTKHRNRRPSIQVRAS